MYKYDYQVFNEIKDLHVKFGRNIKKAINANKKLNVNDKATKKDYLAVEAELYRDLHLWYEETSYLVEHPGFECSRNKRINLFVHTVKLEQKFELITQNEIKQKLSDIIKGDMRF